MGYRKLTSGTRSGLLLLLILGLAALSLIAACSRAPRPVVPRDAPADLQATAAWETYARAASGTQTVAAGEAQQIAHALMATDNAATATRMAQATRTSQEATATQAAGWATATYQADLSTATAQAAQLAAIQTSAASTATAVSVATEGALALAAQAGAATATAQTAGVTATSQAAGAERERLALAREQQLQPLKTYGPWALGLALLALTVGLGSWGLVTAVKAWDARQRVVPTGPFGRPLVLMDGPAGRRTIIDPSRFFAPALQVIEGQLQMPTFVDEERQNQTTARSQAIELRQAEHSPHPPIPLPPPRGSRWRVNGPGSRQLPPGRQPAGGTGGFGGTVGHGGRGGADPVGGLYDAMGYGAIGYGDRLPAGWPGYRVAGSDYPAGLPLAPGQLPFPAEAPWSLLGRQWQGQGLPLGMGARGLLVADPETYPHLLLAGTSGSGKTRFGLRPLISSALVAGWQVAIFDRSGLDFLPFQQHPNAHTILLAEPAQAIEYLAQLYEVVQARFQTLRRACVSTWGRLGGLELDGPGLGRILAVMDEFANLADALPNRERQELWRYARMIAAEGRKAGVHLALALQDPTHKSLDLRIRRNCLPLSFRVKDGDASRVVLGTGGAEQLRPRQFLTIMDQLVRGVAFAPSDEEIQQFLADRPVADLGQPDWLPAPTWEPAPTEPGQVLVLETCQNRPELVPGSENRPVLAENVEPEPVPALPFPTSRPPNGLERRHIRSLARQGLSKNAICRQLYGFKNGTVYGWVSDALNPPGAPDAPP